MEAEGLRPQDAGSYIRPAVGRPARGSLFKGETEAPGSADPVERAEDVERRFRGIVLCHDRALLAPAERKPYSARTKETFPMVPLSMISRIFA